MEVISPTLTLADYAWPIIGGVVFLVAIIILSVSGDGFKRGFGPGLGGGLAVGALIAGFLSIFVDSHHSDMVDDLVDRFEEGYSLTIVVEYRSGNPPIPLTPGDEAEAVKVFLHEIPGEQSIIVEIVGDKYVVTHNGEVREVQND